MTPTSERGDDMKHDSCQLKKYVWYIKHFATCIKSNICYIKGACVAIRIYERLGGKQWC